MTYKISLHIAYSEAESFVEQNEVLCKYLCFTVLHQNKIIFKNFQDKIEASRNELHNLLEKPQLVGIPVLVLGNKRDLPNALDENGLIEKMNLNAIQDREICCYSISCKEKDNIDITLQWLISHSKSGGGQN